MRKKSGAWISAPNTLLLHAGLVLHPSISSCRAVMLDFLVSRLLLGALRTTRLLSLSSHLIYPLTAKVVGVSQMISQPVSSNFFPVLHCPLGLGELQACPFPDVVFPALPLSVLSSSPFHCALQDGFGQTRLQPVVNKFRITIAHTKKS